MWEILGISKIGNYLFVKTEVIKTDFFTFAAFAEFIAADEIWVYRWLDREISK